MDLGAISLADVPEKLKELSGLQSLYLERNHLTTVPDAIGQLTTLKTLWLHENRLASLPDSLQGLVELQELCLHGNAGLLLPDSVLGPKSWESGPSRPATRPADILAYYFKTRKAAAPLNEVKMLLVGRGEAGKSSIRDCLLGFGFDPKKKETAGIEINTWPIKKGSETVRLHVWDFAGQELTHGTHQFFLTERSIYVLVLDARADTQDADAEYWLRLISAFGGDSPVIVALNKWNSKPFDVDRNAIPGVWTFCAGLGN